MNDSPAQSTSGLPIGHGLAAALLGGILLVWAGLMGLSLQRAALPDATDGLMLAVFSPGTSDAEAMTAMVRAGGDVDQLLAQRQSRIPLPFMGDGRDTANAALFLASDEARFITGTELRVDGGMSARCD